MNKKLAKEFLFDLIDIFEKYNIKYAIADGVCLGAIRDNDFIQWDNDIDISVFEQFWCKYPKMQQILRELNKKDIIVTNCWNFTIITFKKYNITANISYIMKDKDSYYKYNNMGRWNVPFKCFDKLELRNFLGREMYFPACVEDFLSYEYGKDWRTPKKDYNYSNFTEKNKQKKRIIIRTVFTYEQ